MVEKPVRSNGRLDEDFLRVLDAVPFFFSFGSWSAAINIAWGNWTIFTITIVFLVVLSVFSMLRDEEKHPRRIYSSTNEDESDREIVSNLGLHIYPGIFAVGLTLLITTTLYLTVWWGHHLRMAEIYLCVFGFVMLDLSQTLRAIHKKRAGVI